MEQYEKMAWMFGAMPESKIEGSIRLFLRMQWCYIHRPVGKRRS